MASSRDAGMAWKLIKRQSHADYEQERNRMGREKSTILNER